MTHDQARHLATAINNLIRAHDGARRVGAADGVLYVDSAAEGTQAIELATHLLIDALKPIPIQDFCQ